MSNLLNQVIFEIVRSRIKTHITQFIKYNTFVFMDDFSCVTHTYVTIHHGPIEYHCYEKYIVAVDEK